MPNNVILTVPYLSHITNSLMSNSLTIYRIFTDTWTHTYLDTWRMTLHGLRWGRSESVRPRLVFSVSSLLVPRPWDKTNLSWIFAQLFLKLSTLFDIFISGGFCSSLFLLSVNRNFFSVQVSPVPVLYYMGLLVVLSLSHLRWPSGTRSPVLRSPSLWLFWKSKPCPTCVFVSYPTVS
jgi:hypothetical protein